jgi:hypothetical protein
VVAALVELTPVAGVLPVCPVALAARKPKAAVALAASAPAIFVHRVTRRTLASRFWICGSRMPMRAFEQQYLKAS